jgi:hypothetical protein
MRRVLQRLRDEEGIALLFALITTAALAAGVTTVVVVSSSSGRTATRATAAQKAYTLAEAGMGSAMALLHGTQADGVTPVNALDSTTLPPPPPSASAQRDDYPAGCTTTCIGYVLWGGTLDPVTQQWTIISKGVVNAPTGPGAAPATRTLTGISQVVPDLTQPVNNQVWNYIYSFAKGGPYVCDVTLANNVTVSAPIYAEGNLCVTNNAQVNGITSNPPTPVSVVVKGKTAFGNSKSAVGTSSAPVVEAHMNLCGSDLVTVHTCNPKPPTKDNIAAGKFDNSPTSVTAVTPDFAGYYNAANPGPKHPCQAASAVNPPSFDNDSTLDLATNGSLGSFLLTPASSYTCKGYDAAGNQVGELSWNAGTRKLTVRGVIYIDGNLSITGTNEYNGQATIYLTGYMDLNGLMCGAMLNGACDYRPGDSSHGGWNPNEEMLIVVAHGSNAGASILFSNSNGAHWQGGLYAANSLNFANNAVVEGPIIAGTVTFSNNITAKPFPIITEVPLGAPGNPNVYANAMNPSVTG